MGPQKSQKNGFFDEIQNDFLGERNITGKEHYDTYSEVVKECNTIKSTVGCIRTADDADEDLDPVDNMDDDEKAKESEVGPPQDASFVTNDYEEMGSHFAGNNITLEGGGSTKIIMYYINFSVQLFF